MPGYPTQRQMQGLEKHRRTLIRDYLYQKMEQAEQAAATSRTAAARNPSGGATETATYWTNVCSGIRWLLAGIPSSQREDSHDSET